MIPRYLIECSCGEKIAVGAGQAGQMVRCGCGRDVDVPLLRDLRRLPTTVATELGSPRASPSNRPRLHARLIFLGVLGTIASLLLSGVLAFARSQVDHSWSHEAQREFDGQVIDSMHADDMFTAWSEMRRDGLGEKQPTIHMLNRNNHVALGTLLRWTLASSAACGLFTAAIALLRAREKIT